MAQIIPAGCLLICLFGPGCSEGGSDPDAGPEPLPLDEILEPGQVRAGVITAERELLTGPDAHGWLGDFKLYNDRVAFVVQNAFEPRGWGPYGGGLLDADWIRPDGAPFHEEFEELFVQIDLLSVEPIGAEVICSGLDCSPAQVRILGRHRGIPLIDAATLGALLPQDLEITHDYILEPDADHLLLRTSLRTRTGSARIVTVGDLVLNGDLTSDFVAGAGAIQGTLPTGELDYYGAHSRSACSVYTGAQGPIQPAFTIEGITLITAGQGMAPRARGDAAPLTVERILIVGRGGMDDCLRKLRRLRGQEQSAGLISGMLRTNAGEPETSASLRAHDLALDPNADVVGQTYAAADGSYELELPEGSYRLEANAPGRMPVVSETIHVVAGQTASADLALAEPAVLAWACTAQDRDGHDLGWVPCKISLQAGVGAAMDAPVATDLLTFSAAGEGSLVTRPGDWTVTLSRGWEYSIDRHEITLQPGGRVEIEGLLVRQVDTRGWIAADLHNHSTRSVDSEYELMDKLRSNVVEGLELMVATDHDCQTDFEPLIKALSVADQTEIQRWLRTVVGNEISPMYGHMTAFPLPVHPTGWNFWQIPWTEYQDGRFVRSIEFPELFSAARQMGAQIINVAHPTTASAWFHHLGIDPLQPLPAIAGLPQDKWGTDFDTLELLNAKDVDVMLEQVLPLWSQFNNQGLFKTASGVSDSHGRSNEAGFGRTMVRASTDAPDALDLSEIWTNLRAGRALVGGGIFVTIEVDGEGPGELVSQSSPIQVRLRVEAADWVPVERVDLIANGQVVASQALAAPGELDPDHPAVRFDGSLSIEAQLDTWFAALALGPEGSSLNPVFRGARPVGMTNAVRVDVDGDGLFSPPGLGL